MFQKGGMGGLYKEAQKMQKKMSQVQSEIDALEIKGESGGGMVTVLISGKKTLISIDINPDIIKEDKEMLEDLILVAINNAIQKVDDISKEKMSSITGGMNVPGLF